MQKKLSRVESCAMNMEEKVAIMEDRDALCETFETVDSLATNINVLI